MSSATTRAPDESVGRTPLAVSVTLSREQVVLWAIVGGQALWLGFILMRGWYSAADLPNLAYANGRSLDWSYLTSSLGGHFGVAQRLVYWLLNRATPLQWWLTVLIRLAFQALTTVLLWRLFRTLVGARPWLWIVLVGYAFSAYLVPGMAPLNSGLGLGISQACLVGAMLAQVRYTRERRLIDAGVVAVLVLLMLAFAQESFPTLAFLPILSFVFLQRGSWRERVRGGLSLWRGWLLLGVALAAFAALYLAGSYNSPSSEFTARDGLWLAVQAWATVLGPALVGGPWRFYSLPDQWSAYADVPVVLIVLGQVVLLGLIVLSVLRTGWIALVAWFIPVWTAVATLLLVASGRWWLGPVLPGVLRYSYYVPVGLAVGIVLAFGTTPAAGPPSGWGTGLSAFVDRVREDSRLGRFAVRRRRAIVGSMVGLLLLSSAFSAIGWADRFWQNPAKNYVAAVLRNVQERGPDVQLYDTLLPEGVVPYISQMDLSDLFGLGRVSADFASQSADRLVVSSAGLFVPATFIKVADYAGRRQPGCGIFVSGEGTTRIPLTPVSREQAWFLQLQLYQPRPNRVRITVLDDRGHELPMASGSSRIETTGTLVVLHRRLETGIPAVIELTSSDPGTNFCLVHTYVGIPVS